MRTKTLLIGAAALAAAVISSQASTVYSANIVGYANLSLTTGYNLVVNQFNIDTNGANEIFGDVPDGTAFLQFNGSGYTYTYKDYSAPPAIWYMSDYSTPTNPPIILPGTAVFLLLPNNATNTEAGTVVPNVGQTNTVNLATGYNMVGSATPYAGSLSNSVFGFTPPDGTALLQFNGNGYTYNYFDQSAPPVQWYMDDYSTPTNAPNVSVGQGYFLLLPSSWQWSQSLTNM